MFGEVMGKSLVSCFFDSRCISMFFRMHDIPNSCIPARGSSHQNAKLVEVLGNSDVNQCRLTELTFKHQPQQLSHIDLQRAWRVTTLCVCVQLIHFIYNNYAEIWRQEMSNRLPIVQYISYQTAHPTLTRPFLILRLTFRQQQKVIKNLSESFQNETYTSVTSSQISTHKMPQSAWKWDSWLEKCQSSHSRHGLQHLPVTLSQS